MSDYIIGMFIHSSKKQLVKKLFLATSVIINLFVLCYFKYAYFFTDAYNAFFQTDYQVFNHFAQFTNGTMGTHFDVDSILLPVGISFYTFQTISYSVDIYREQIKPVKNILDFKHSIDEIENLPNTEIIIGSPPCVSFSSSNKSGNADKSLGVDLTQTFLRIVAVKKHQPNSVLKAWFMENVVNSKRYLQTAYTFKDLGLTEWANNNRISPLKIAIDLYDNTTIINSADYGSFQARKRVISGEIIKKRKLIIPKTTHSENGLDGKEKYLITFVE